jgi:hypothetical protein
VAEVNKSSDDGGTNSHALLHFNVEQQPGDKPKNDGELRRELQTGDS